MIQAQNMNFVAGSAVHKHDLLTIDTTNSSAQVLAAKPATDSSCVIGQATCDASAGGIVHFQPLAIGQVVVCKAAGAISAGAQLGVSSTSSAYGQVVTGGALPLFAVDAATAAGDLIRVVCAAALDANT